MQEDACDYLFLLSGKVSLVTWSPEFCGV